jgi:H+-translocating NAD(P) transhydrogenase subunit alpha
MSVESVFQGIRQISMDVMGVSVAPGDTVVEDIFIQGATLAANAPSHFMTGLTVFVLACFVGYYVVWRVTPALHSPLMAVTNAISSVIIVGAILTGGVALAGTAKALGAFAVFLAAINIFGGFAVTGRMLRMFEKKK